MAEEAPVVRLVNAILVDAIRSNASDIHIEPLEESMIIRCRIDGVFETVDINSVAEAADFLKHGQRPAYVSEAAG